MRHVQLVRVAVTGLLALTACRTESPPDTPQGPTRIPVTQSDSAGIPFYALSELPGWDDPAYAWALSLESAVPTGGATLTDEPLLYAPQALTSLDDGTLVVLDGADPRLAVVNPELRTVTTRFASTGKGPGEIWSSATVLWPADAESFWALDSGTARLSRFSVSGELREERPVRSAGMGGVAVQEPGTGTPWYWRFFFDEDDPGILRDSIGRFDMEARAIVNIAALPPRVLGRRRNTDPHTLFLPLSWFAPTGAGVVTGRGDRGRLEHRAANGELLAVIELPMVQRDIPISEHPEILEEFRSVVGGRRRAVPAIADRYPLFSFMWGVNDTLFALEQGHRSTPAGEPPIPADRRVWRVFSVRGDYAGSILLPSGFQRPIWVDRGRITGLRRDSLDIPTIETYSLTPPYGG